MSEIKAPSEVEIQQRAYELFLERGCEPGRDVEDWLKAEQELTELVELTASETEELRPESQEPIVRKKHAAAGLAAGVTSSV
jgi:Protein of unknown function (DUF2934)